jgi:hypothetical protein
MVAQVEYSMVGRSRCRVAPCAVYTVHVETRSVCFLVEPENQGRRFISGLMVSLLSLKTKVDGLSVV